MKVLRGNLLRFGKFAGLQFINYFALTLNYRAVAAEQYAWAIITDTLICILGWSLIKLIADTSDAWSRAGYILGGGVASTAAIWITRSWL